jgi:hypothetical protein
MLFGRFMDQREDSRNLERKIEQATRIASRVTDPTTVERLKAWIEDLKQNLRQRLEARRIKQETTVRAREIWQQNDGPPANWSLASSRGCEFRGPMSPRE